MGLLGKIIDGDAASAGASNLGEQSKGAQCNFYNLELGNNIGHWEPDRPGIKKHYDKDMKGSEIHYWWPGKAAKGECNNIEDGERGCWYKGRLLNDPSCDDKQRCLHVAAHDGEPSHTYTCPTWLMNEEGIPCQLPPGWQACPRQFKLLRADSGVPQDFGKALASECGAMKEESCLGNTELETNVGMYFDVRQNQWYRCTPRLKCERFDIQEITDLPKGKKCGHSKNAKACGEDELCFDHRITSKKSTFHCMPKNKVFLISSGEAGASSRSMPLELAMFLPPANLRSHEGCSRPVAGNNQRLHANFL